MLHWGVLKGIVQRCRQQHEAQSTLAPLPDRTRVTHVTCGNTHQYTTMTFSCSEFRESLSFRMRAANIGKAARGESRSEPCNPVRPHITYTSPTTLGKAQVNKNPIETGIPNLGARDGGQMFHLASFKSIPHGCRQPHGAQSRAALLPGIELGSPV